MPIEETSTPTAQSVRGNPAPASPRPGKLALSPHRALYGHLGTPEGLVELSKAHFKKLLASVLDQVNVDEVWYTSRYVDVAEAIKRGERASAKDHYMAAGYFEDRLPRRIPVNEEWYLETYPDVEDGIIDGEFTSAQEHFELAGFQEGRLPFAGWTFCG